MPSFGQRQSDPLRGQNAAELDVRKQCDIPVQGAQTGDEPISPFGNLCGHFTMRTTATKNIPVRPILTFGYFLSGMSRNVLCTVVCFDSGNDPRIGDDVKKGSAIFLLLADRLVV